MFVLKIEGYCAEHYYKTLVNGLCKTLLNNEIIEKSFIQAVYQTNDKKNFNNEACFLCNCQLPSMSLQMAMAAYAGFMNLILVNFTL